MLPDSFREAEAMRAIVRFSRQARWAGNPFTLASALSLKLPCATIDGSSRSPTEQGQRHPRPTALADIS